MDEKLRAYIAEARQTVALQRVIIDEQRGHIEHLRQEATDCRTKLQELLKAKQDRLDDMEKMMADILEAKQNANEIDA